jgi:hypothetical protein
LSEAEENLLHCPYCDIQLRSNPVNENILLVECLNPNCKDLVEFNDHLCESCGVGFTEEDWDLFVSTANPSIIEKIKSFYASNDPLMICCEKTMMDCVCVYPVSWEDTDDVPQDVWENIYADSFSNDCFTCSYQYTEFCKPLCNFVVEYAKSASANTSISVCGDYYPDESTSHRLRAAETNNYIYMNYEEF